MSAGITIPGVGFEIPLDITIVGALTGMTYGLLAVGLTLVYKVSRVINFAHGALGALPAILVPQLVIKAGVPYAIAVPLALLAGVAGGALLQRTVIQRLAKASRLIVLVATIAVAQIVGVALILLQGPKAASRDPGYFAHLYPTPFHTTVTVGSVRLGPAQLLILMVAPLLALGLTVFMRSTTLGLAARASAENPDAALMTGVPVRRVSMVIWAVAGLFAAASAILVAGTQPLDSNASSLGPSLLVRGLAAAMIGGLDSLPLVFAGGVGIGIVEVLVQWNYPAAGVLNPILFGVILASLALHRRLGSSVRGDTAQTGALTAALRTLPPHLAGHRRVRKWRRHFINNAIGITAAVALHISTGHDVLLATVLLFALMGLSLVVLTGYAGQISLGQYAFVALGAIVGGRMQQLGFPAGSAILYALVACAGLAAVIGIAALRVRGLFLAVVTLAFAIAADSWLFNQHWLNHGGTGFATGTSLLIKRPHWFGINFSSERSYTLLCLTLLVVVGYGVYRLRSTGIGRAMIAVRDNEPAAASLSLSPRRVKMTAFVIAGLIAGLAGYFYGGLLVDFTVAVRPSPIETSLSLVVMVVLGGVTTVTGAVLGALWVVGIPYAFGTNAGLLSSAFGVLAVLLIWPGGLASLAFRIRDIVVDWLVRKAPAAPPVAATTARATLPPRTTEAPAPDATPALVARNITVRFGGNTAVDDVSVVANPGEIVGLIGPNGAGKTTLFDVLSGHQTATTGSVEVRDLDVTALRPEERAQLGLGRTFQQARLFQDLTVLEAVQIGLERGEPSEVVPSLLALPPSWRAERRKRVRAREIVDLLGLGPFEARRVGELSTGMRRIAELACVVAVGADVILLDEPTAGIAQAEIEQFVPVISEIRAHLGATLLLIEHDIPMLMSLADRVYVLAAGRVICEGAPDAVRNDPAVIDAYLGTDDRVVHRSNRPAQRSRSRTTPALSASGSSAGGSR